MERKKVLLGMSGGVDSSAAALVLKEQGYEVIGVTMQLFGKNEDNVRDAKAVCDNLKIEHYVYDYSEEFLDTVITDFLEQYQNAKTPNPCIVCNKFLKFGKMMEEAKKLGADYIATGHYANVEFVDGKYLLKKSEADKKDQTYVLYNLTQDLLAHVLFPLGKFNSKDEIRKLAQNAGLDVANKPDSQEICFIPDNDYAKFIEERVGKFQEGNIVDIHGKILGKHKGIIHYTIGQRKGLGISSKEPLFVVSICKERNEVVVGGENDLYSNELFAVKVNYISGVKPEKEFRCAAKIRYAAKPVECTVYPLDGEKIKVVFDEKQRAITPGQSVVLYDDNIILGGGIII